MDVDAELKKIAADKGAAAVTDDLRKSLQAIRDTQMQIAAAKGGEGIAKSIGFNPAQVDLLKQELVYIQSMKTSWEAAGMSAQTYNQVLAQINKQMADLNAKTGGFSAGAKAAFADFTASIKSSGQFMQEFIARVLTAYPRTSPTSS